MSTHCWMMTMSRDPRNFLAENSCINLYHIDSSSPTPSNFENSLPTYSPEMSRSRLDSVAWSLNIKLFGLGSLSISGLWPSQKIPLMHVWNGRDLVHAFPTSDPFELIWFICNKWSCCDLQFHADDGCWVRLGISFARLGMDYGQVIASQ